MSLGQPANQPSRESYTTPEPSKQDASNQDVLDQVLQETLLLANSDEPLTPEELRPLIAVARRRRGEPLSVEIVLELVQTALRMRFRKLVESRQMWEKMTSQIAETIFHDPQSHQRIQSLWTKLSEAAQ